MIEGVFVSAAYSLDLICLEWYEDVLTGGNVDNYKNGCFDHESEKTARTGCKNKYVNLQLYHV